MSPLHISSRRTATGQVSAKNPFKRCVPLRAIFLLISKETSPWKILQSFFRFVLIIYVIILITEIRRWTKKVNHQLRILCFIFIKTYFLPGKGVVVWILACKEGPTGILVMFQPVCVRPPIPHGGSPRQSQLPGAFYNQQLSSLSVPEALGSGFMIPISHVT